MVEDYGANRLTPKNVRDIAVAYREKFLDLKRTWKFGPFDEEIFPKDDHRQMIEEIIQHLKKKVTALIRNFLKRLNLTLTLSLVETEGDVRVMTSCPACKLQVNLFHCVVYDGTRPAGQRLGLRCYKCGAERWIS